MSTNKLNISREQLAAFLKDHRTIRQFENLFHDVGVNTPAAVDKNELSSDTALTNSNMALAAIQRIADALELLALAPAQQIIMGAVGEDLTPSASLGTISTQNSDSVSITGGVVSAQLRNNQSVLLETTVTLTNGAAAAAGTLSNAPVAGNPTKWVGINDNGTTRYIPAW